MISHNKGNVPGTLRKTEIFIDLLLLWDFKAKYLRHMRDWVI